MTTVGEIMTPDPQALGSHEDLVVAAHRMRVLEVGALPVRHRDGSLAGIITDRDIVVHCVADGTDPRKVDAGELAQERVVTVDSSDSVAEALEIMADQQLRRLLVVEGDDLVGIVAQADLARAVSCDDVGTTVREISKNTATPKGGL